MQTDNTIFRDYQDRFRLIDNGGSISGAKNRRDLSARLYSAFPDLSEAMRTLRSDKMIWRSHDRRLDEIIDQALAHQLLKPSGHGFKIIDAFANRFLTGGWLEELTALALLDAGCKTVRYSQRLSWRASYDNSEHFNEVDAMADYRGRMVLASCKAVAGDTLDERIGEERIFDALQELSYWNDHFGKGDAVLIFATTADFYNEKKRTFHAPKLVERAKVMGIEVIPVDFGSYERFANRVSDILRYSVRD